MILVRGCPRDEDGGVNTPTTSAPSQHGTAPRTPPTGRRWAALALGAVALGLAACGSSSSSSTTTTSPPATSTSTTAPSTSTTGGSSTTTAVTPTTAGTTSCATSALAITVGSPNGSAGAIHYQITFRNTGSASCTLYGYPGVSFLSSTGTQIGAPAQREGSGGATTVTIPAGGNAYSSVAVTDPGIPPCSGSATATQVRIFPPGQTQFTSVAAPSGLQVCSSPNTPAYSSAIVTPVSTTAL